MLDQNWDQDPFDPRYWDQDESEVVKHIQLSNRFDVSCVIDMVDYSWVRTNLWTLTRSSVMPEKQYAKRVERFGSGLRKTLFLHREIMMLVEPISEYYQSILKVDHINGNSLDNRRQNLRWATDGMNSKNVKGIDWVQPDLVGYDIPQICEKQTTKFEVKENSTNLTSKKSGRSDAFRQLSFKF